MVAGELLYESMVAEHGTEVPDADLTAVGRMRRALFRGEEITPNDAERFGLVKGSVSTLIHSLRALGMEVEAVDHEDGPRGYRLADPDQPPDRDAVLAWAAKRAVNDKAQKVKRTKARRAQKQGEAVEHVQVTPPPSLGMELPPLPGLGATVTCVGQVMDTDGSIKLMWRNGQHSWLTTLTGAGPS